jgi:hypothetical protein
MPAVIGLDTAKSCTGVTLVPDGWDGSRNDLVTKAIRTQREQPAFGSKAVLAKLELERYHKIAEQIVGFIQEHDVEYVVMEEYAFSKGGVSSSFTGLVELGGIVRSQVLLACGIAVPLVKASSARSKVSGGLKRKGPKGEGAKLQMKEILRKRGIMFSTLDEMDAFVVAYHSQCELEKKSSIFLPQQDLFS